MKRVKPMKLTTTRPVSDPPADKPASVLTHTMSAFDGISTTAFDTGDARSMLYAFLENLAVFQKQGDTRRLIAIVPHRFFGVQDGFFVMTYDPKLDPRYVAPPSRSVKEK